MSSRISVLRIPLFSKSIEIGSSHARTVHVQKNKELFWRAALNLGHSPFFNWHVLSRHWGVKAKRRKPGTLALTLSRQDSYF